MNHGSRSDDDGAMETVLRVLEGLRGDAFQKAKDIGISALSQPNGLRTLIAEIKAMVFPLGTLEAQALFRSGQAIRGPLSRQDGESVVSYIGRRRRWWTLMTQLDSRISLSDSLRAELLLEMSGLTKDQQLMIKACAGGAHEFEVYARIMTEHHGLIHLRGNRLLDSAPHRNPGNDKDPRRWQPNGTGRYGYQAFEPSTAEYLNATSGAETAYVSQEHRTDEHYNDAWYQDENDDDGDDAGWNAWTELPGQPTGYTAQEAEVVVSDEETAVALNAMEDCDFEGYPDASGEAIKQAKEKVHPEVKGKGIPL